jgi:predicted PurR-regulated permease PerM
MNDRQQGTASWMFSLVIVAGAAFVAQRFFLPLAWGAILCIATWPLYLRIVKACGNRPLPGALVTVTSVALVFMIPLLLFTQQAIHQAPALAALVERTNAQGLAAPDWVARIPLVGGAVADWWASTLAQPHGLTHLLRAGADGSAHSAREMLHRFGAQLLHRTIDLGLAFVFLFFFYKDGAALMRQVKSVGERCVGAARWELYAAKVPAAIRATVNGLVLVGLAEGVLLGIGYEVAGLPSAALWAAASGVLGIIPFGAPLVFLSVSAVLLAQGNPGAAAGVALWGTCILFVADHFVRPTMIGTATRLPFLAVLVGILGGVEVLGLVGLFLGPVAMTLFVTLWNEAPPDPAKTGACSD